MMIKRIQGCTRELGKSQGYLGLPVRDVIIFDKAMGCNVHAMRTAWEPTPEELAKLNAGEPVILQVLGHAHPPVLITVGDDDAPALDEAPTAPA